MRNLIFYVLIALVYKVESRTLCEDQRCVCSNKENILQLSCSSHPSVLGANYSLPNNVSLLDLSRNNLTRIERSPSLASTTLTRLYLVNNQIKEISTDALSLPSLEILDLSHNQIEFIHRDTFASIKNLKYLNLANNKFNAFGSLNFYHLSKLQCIILDYNDIGPSLEIHGLFEEGYELSNEIQSISLRNVKLSSDNKHILINNTNHLKNLTLAQNNISYIIDLPHNLEYLDLSYNPIEKISGNAFLFSIHLSELKLNNLLVEEVPDFAFFYLISLRKLDLAGNARLKKISPLAWGRIIPKDQTDLLVENLSLRGASLTSLDSQLKRIFKKIKKVDLRNNPWNCDCQLSWLQNIQIPNELNDVRCSTPQHLNNKRILELKWPEFACEESAAPSGIYLKTSVNIVVYCTLVLITILMLYFFIFSPKHFMYRQLPVEFPRTP